MPDSKQSRSWPWLLLAAFIGVNGLLLAITGHMRTTIVADTQSYLDLPLTSLTAAMNHVRTPGYPIFLLFVRQFSANYAVVPVLQYLLFAGAVTLFFAGLNSDEGFGRSAPWIAGSLLTCNALWFNVSTVATDALAAACGIAAVGALLLRAQPTRRRWIWNGVLTALTALAWLIRPAALFLVPVLVALGPLLRLRQQKSAFGLRSCLRDMFACLAMGAGPLIVYCSLRLALVGKFSIVAFGGYNLVGITGQFLNTDMLADLPEDLRPVAAAALKRWESLPRNEFQHLDLSPLSYIRMESNSDLFIWKIYTPAALDVFGDDPIVVNTQLKRLGFEMVRLRPQQYALWLVKATQRSLLKLAGDAVWNPFGVVLTFLISIVLTGRVVEGWVRGDSGISGDFPATSLMFPITAIYAALSMLLVIVICPPIGRMTDAAGLWIPSLQMALLTDLLRQKHSP